MPLYRYSEADIQEFTASGVWIKPPGAKSVEVILIGGGAGGGSGLGSTMVTPPNHFFRFA